jgi:hypothetical protein
MKKTHLMPGLIVLILIAIILAGCASANPTATTLTMTKHALQGMPQVDPLTFVPLEGTTESILQAHASERSDVLVQELTFTNGNPTLNATLNGKSLVAEQYFIGNGTDSYITVSLDGSEIYRISTGPGSPVTSLAGLWSFDQSWALESVLINNNAEPFTTGQVSIDGTLQNQAGGYQEAFGFQILAGSPFYFFMKDGKAGYNYDGQETMFDLDEIPHYNCCSATVLNPIQARNMVSFFGRSSDHWYYVEIGQSTP